jgi:AAA15 family ATPase/GTPase
MFIEFGFSNFRSIKTIISFDMVMYQPAKADKQPTLNSVFTVDKHLKLLKTVVFYGSTASGKTNIAGALAFMRQSVLADPFSNQPTDEIARNRFRLRADFESEPSYFRIAVMIGGVKYGYGFFITPERVDSEWLSYASTSDADDTHLFDRENDKEQSYISEEFSEGHELIESIPQNALLLSMAARSGGAISNKLVDWFSSLQIISRVNHPSDLQAVQTLMSDKKNKDAVVRFLRKLSVDITDIQFEPADAPSILVHHNKYDAERNVVGTETFSIEDESAGTQRLLTLALPIMTALEQGHPIFIDDLSAHLHPHTIRAIVELFTKKQQNPHNAQLMFTTHDTSLLTSLRWRREQVHFVEKDDEGGTSFYPMSEFGQTKLDYMERDYLAGRYGATPSTTRDILPLHNSDDAQETEEL